MKRMIFLAVFILLFLKPSYSISSEHGTYLPKWIELLEKGNERQRKLALHSLWFLEYPEFRKDIKVFDPILNALKDKNPSIREAAAACLKRIGELSKGCCRETKIVPSLIESLGDSSSRVREEAAKALGYYKDERAVDALIATLRDKDPWVRLNVVFALGELKALKAVDTLLNLLEDDSDWRNKFVQQECVIALRKIGSPKAIGSGGGVIRITPETRRPDGKIVTPGTSHRETQADTKIGGFDEKTTSKVIAVFIRKSDDPYLRALIIGAFAQFKAAEAREILLKAKEDPDEKIRRLALDALLQISAVQPREDLRIRPELSKRYSEDMLDMLEKSMKDPSAQIRANAIAALGKSGDERAVDLLIDALRDSDHTVRRNAIEGLGQFRDEKILDSMLSFFGKRRLYLDDLEQLAVKTFMSVAEKTTREWVFVHRRDGVRHVSKNTFDIPKEAKVSRRMVHPTAVGKLLDFFNQANPEGKQVPLTLFRSFEDERIKEVLLKLLGDPSPQLRAGVISLVPYFFDNIVVPRLIVASKDKDVSVRVAGVRALGEFDEKRGLEPLIERLRDSHWEVRAATLHSLKGHDDPRLSDIVIKLLSDDSASVRRSAVSNIMERKDGRAVEALIDRLNDEDFLVPSWSADALGAIGDRKAVVFLTKKVKGEFSKSRMFRGDMDLRRSAIKSLGLIGDREAVPVLISVLEERELKNEAIVALGSIKDPKAVPDLIKCLSDDDPYVRRLAASALREIGDPAGLEAVKDIPEDKPPPSVGSGAPIRPTDLKRPAPAIRGGPLPGSGYSVTMFGSRKEGEEKTPPAKEEQPAAIPTPHPAGVVTKYDLKPRPSVDIKPLLSKLRANDPRVRREAADALGDIGNQEATDHLIPLLKDMDEYVRQAAARALGRLKDKKAVEPLIVNLKDPDVNVRAFSAWALGEIQDTMAIEPLCISLFDKEQKVRDQSFEALRTLREPISRTMMVNTLIRNAKVQSSAEEMLSRLIRLEGQGGVLKALEDPSGDHTKTVKNYIHLMEANIYYNISDIATKALEDYPDREMVIKELSNYIGYQAGTPTRSISLLGSLKDRRALPILLDTLKKRKDSYYRLTVVNAIGELGDKEVVDPLLQILTDEKEFPGPRNATAMALGKIGAEEAGGPLINVLKNKKDEKHVRIGVAVGLGMLKNKMAVEPLVKILKNNQEDIWLRVAVAGALGNIGDERAIEPLEVGMKDPSDYLRHAVEIALRKLKTAK